MLSPALDLLYAVIVSTACHPKKYGHILCCYTIIIFHSALEEAKTLQNVIVKAS